MSDLLSQFNNISHESAKITSLRLIDHPKGMDILPSRCEATSVKVLLDRHRLEYIVETRANIEYISTNGRFPVVIVNEEDIVSGFDALVLYLNKMGYSLSKALSPEAKCEMEAYAALITGRLEVLELYTSWLIEDNYMHVTLPAYTAHLTWPLSSILPLYKRRQVTRLVTSKGDWNDISEEMMMAETKSIGTALTQRLASPGTFFKHPTSGEDILTELDCLVYGHLNAIFMTKLPSYRMKRALGLHPRLIEFCKYLESEHNIRVSHR